MFAKVVGFALSFILPLLIVRFMDQEKVGLYRQSFLVVSTLISVLPLGISLSAYYFLARESENRASTICNILIFNFAAGALAFFGLYFYPQILGKIFQSEAMVPLAPFIGLVIWLWIFSTFLEVVTLANRETRLASLFIILAQFTKTALMAGAVIIFGTVEAFLYAAVIQGVLQTIVLMIYLNSRFPGFWKSFRLQFFRIQLFYALPFGLSGLLWTLQIEIHNYFVGYRFSEAEYAIYAYGCFQLPLIGMLFESTTAVLTPRMSELQLRGEKREMLLLTMRATEKLSLFYFPVYVFLIITAEVFIITLFTRNYLASVPIMLINLTLLPFEVWVIDPMVRAHKELGRVLIISRIFITIALVVALYFGIQYFDLRGMITIVVIVNVIEKIIVSLILAGKLGIKWADWRLFKNVGKMALASAFTGIITLFAFWQIKEIAFNYGALITQRFFVIPTQNTTDFVSGSLTLGLTFLIFVPIYIFSLHYLNLISKEEKDMVRRVFGKLQSFSGKNKAKIYNSNL
jgi:O-antigen/teichoic acid export membrane protein